MRNLLTTDNTKTKKGEKLGFKTYVMHLAPAELSGHQACAKASPGCKLACLNTAGMGAYSSVQQARIKKTKMFFEERDAFLELLIRNIKTAIKSAKKNGLIPLFRLNATSDIPWETIRVPGYRNVFEMFPEAQFYDYTKIIGRTVPKNYHLTFSRAENNSRDVEKAVGAGMNVAVVFRKVPETYMGLRVVVGDETDVRVNDAKGVIVGLTAKGRAKKDSSGFVVI